MLRSPPLAICAASRSPPGCSSSCSCRYLAQPPGSLPDARTGVDAACCPVTSRARPPSASKRPCGATRQPGLGPDDRRPAGQPAHPGERDPAARGSRRRYGVPAGAEPPDPRLRQRLTAAPSRPSGPPLFRSADRPISGRAPYSHRPRRNPASRVAARLFTRSSHRVTHFDRFCGYRTVCIQVLVVAWGWLRWRVRAGRRGWVASRGGRAWRCAGW